MTVPTPAADAPATTPEPYTIWALHCPFRKDGAPVLGTFGSETRGVVIIEVETWKRLCRDVPQLQTAQFRVGTFE